MTAAKIKERLGLSPLADAVMDSVQWGAARIYCLPVSATEAGTLGEVKHTGEGKGTLTLDGSPTNAFGIIVEITGQGTLNTAAFKVSIDGGYSYSDETTVPLTGEDQVHALAEHDRQERNQLGGDHCTGRAGGDHSRG